MQAKADPISEELGRAQPRGLIFWPNRWRWRLSLLALLALAAFAVTIWIGRERIAANLIDDALNSAGLEASYEIEEIGPQRQILSNLVIGDTARPDLTVERVVVDIAFSLGSPGIGRVELVKPRLYGSFRGGQLSLGALDPILFAESDEPSAGLPSTDVSIVDGRARFDSDYGVFGIKLDGAGPLNDGFAGTLAATAPGLGVSDCSAETATIYGDLTISSGAPRFEGPIRFDDVVCEGGTVKLAHAAATVTVDKDFSSVDADLGLRAEDLTYSDFAIAELGGSAGLSWNVEYGTEGNRPGGNRSALNLRHDLEASKVSGPSMRLANAELDGTVRSDAAGERIDWDLTLVGEDARLELEQIAGISSWRESVSGTMLETLLAKFERGMSRALEGGRLVADATVRVSPEGTSVILPEARLRSALGETIVALSRANYSSATGRIAGNILSGGPDLPQISGRMEQDRGEALALRLSMAEFREGDDALAIPRLQITQDSKGRYGFAGLLQAEGAIPGGTIKGGALPLEGVWSPAAGLSLGRRCAPLRFARLAYYSLELRRHEVSVCPGESRAMVRYRDQIEVSAQIADLILNGDLAGTPSRVSAKRVAIGYPGPFAVEDLSATIGSPDNSLQLFAQTLEGSFADTIGGSFGGGTAALDVVPLDLSELDGQWSYEDSVLQIGEGGFTLTERTESGLASDARFESLVARGVRLTLEDNRIQTVGDLIHPASDNVLASLEITHDLNSSEGKAEIAVPGITFAENFQPTDLSYLASGVIESARGTITGEGRVSWNADDIESSGVFRSDGIDFAAAFGPVRGVEGEVVLTDLLNLTTAPRQVLKIGSVNPGVEALAGRVVYSITNGETITVNEGRWPFMGGELILRPVEVAYGTSGGQSYIFELIALDAATFVAQMELTNLGASGAFDGTIPIYFDEQGNGSINAGLLISRPPGGNIAYVGDLTYEDLGAIGNYTFQSLRSLDYNQMAIELNGSLAGEIVTKFTIDGVRQGADASRNFITRQLAELPIRFNISVRSENFYLLSKVVRGFFDPTIFDQEIIREQLGIGNFAPIESSQTPEPQPSPDPEQPSAPVDNQRRDESLVQPPESDELP